jgi:hypothetical protein
MKKFKLLFLIAILWTITCYHGQSNKPNDKLFIQQHARNDSIADDCVRSIPQPIIIKTKYPNAKFKLIGRTGYETLTFQNGDMMEIENGGCEYYSLIFRFKTSTFVADSTNFKGSCEQFIMLLSKIKPAIDCPLDLKMAINSIEKLKNNKENLRLDQEIIIEPGEIRQFATINRVSKISDKVSVFEIRISIGPL